MRGRRKKDEAAPPSDAVATPFFARFLEGQHDDEDDADAKVTERRGRASYTEKQGGRKSTSRVSKTTAAKPAKLHTLKYPSDGDEQVFYPYHAEAATIKGGSARQTLKYPSDRDEVIDPYVAIYINAADAPKTATGRAKKGAKIALTSKSDDIDQVS
ncbi:MAG TPA: microviridin/marinostatin family tricyclic proteinase inhibitor [Pyrinomonadaceae bacterium]|jgi:hypothetical protein|nr:microviridin/marinostatin family tricyclic proteinase inhibitor [Pyrinomonadaceae bacterium]